MERWYNSTFGKLVGAGILVLSIGAGAGLYRAGGQAEIRMSDWSSSDVERTRVLTDSVDKRQDLTPEQYKSILEYIAKDPWNKNREEE